tara:strand:+ start:492 stop:683 length:192 start_codon:yes stop_codon:yes gene_type:complete
MNITYAKYVNQIGILTTTADASFLNIKIDDGDLMSVPISTDNMHYNECKSQIDAGTLVPEKAD